MIRRTLIVLLITINIVACFATPSLAAMESSNYAIPISVVSGGGAIMHSSNYELACTLGQSSPLGIGTSANFELKAGFWENAVTLMMHKMGLTPAILLLLLGE